jgi:hypothetical protein
MFTLDLLSIFRCPHSKQTAYLPCRLQVVLHPLPKFHSDSKRWPTSPKRQVTLHTSLAAAIIPCLVFLQRVELNIMLTTPGSGFLYFESGMCWRIRPIRTIRVLHSWQGSTYVVAIYPTPSAIYAFHWLSAALILSAMAIYRMPHYPIYVQLWDLTI